MTTIQIQEKLKTEFETKVFNDIQLFGDKSVQVFVQDFPLSQDYEYEGIAPDGMTEAEKYCPCVIIKAVSGEVTAQNIPQTSRIEIFALSKDWSEDRRGYKDVFIMLDRIRDYLVSGGGIHGTARMQYPLKMHMVEDDFPTPFWEGAITTNWSVYTKPYEDIERLL